MASMPRWPLPSGSNPDGPMGSSTTASLANSESQPSRSPLSTAVIDRTDMSRAGCDGYLSIPSIGLLKDSVVVAADEEPVAVVAVGAGHARLLAVTDERPLARPLPVAEDRRRRVE